MRQLRKCCTSVLALLVGSSVGCGTLGTMLDPEFDKWEPYSGVVASANGHATQIDVPFSFVLATACLPITIPKRLIEGAREGEGEETGTPPPESPPSSRMPKP